jgi:hypothetical protein
MVYKALASGVQDVVIKCKCGVNTTRRVCKVTQEFHDDIAYTNYFCPDCGNFLRCDSQLPPPPKQDETQAESTASKDTNVTDDAVKPVKVKKSKDKGSK